MIKTARTSTRLKFLNRTFFFAAVTLIMAECGLAQNLSRVDSMTAIYNKMMAEGRLDSNFIKITSQLCLELENVDFRKAVNLFINPIREAEHKKNVSAMASLYNEMGKLYTRHEYYSYAIKYYYKSYILWEELKAPIASTYTLIDFANIFFAQGSYTLPLEYYMKAAGTFRRVRNDEGLCVAYNNIGLVKEKQNELDSALYYFFLAYNIRKKIDDPFIWAHSMKYIGRTFIEKHDTAVGIYYCRKAIGILTSIRKKRVFEIDLEAELNLLIGKALLASASPARVRPYFDNAIRKYSIVNDRLGLADTYLALAEHFNNNKEYGEAMKNLEIAQSFTRDLHYLNAEKRISEMQVEIAVKTNRLSMVDQSFRNYKRIMDSIFNINLTEHWAEVRTAILKNQFEQEQEISKLQIQSAHTEIKNQKVIRNILMLAGLILLALVLDVVIMNNRIRKINRQLRSKNDEVLDQKGRIEAQQRLLMNEIREKELAQEAVKEQEFRNRFSKQLIVSQENERKRIAAELHDSVGQNLLVIKNLALMEQQNQERSGVKAEYVEGISNMASETLNELRQISYDLRPAHLERLGLTASLEHLVANLTSATKLEIRSEITDLAGIFRKESEINVYRIIQEALNNVIKHSEAGKVGISVRERGGFVEILLTDDGKGFKFDQKNVGASGMGLSSLVERTEMMSGKIRITSSPGKGTVIRVEIPVSENIDEVKDTDRG